MIGPILPKHHADILQLNAEFVHWLSPLDASGLRDILARADYARQIGDGQGALIAYAHNVDVPGHRNLAWLRPRLDNFLYVDRVIIAANAQGKGYGTALYSDVCGYARAQGYDWIACEVNTVPENPGSHRFHLSQGFLVMGEQELPDDGKAVRYYKRPVMPTGENMSCLTIENTCEPPANKV